MAKHHTVAGRRREADEGEVHGAGGERWTVSYLDMVTVLMVTFIILFAMSSINSAKFEQLKNSLQTGFGVVKTQKVDTAKGVVVPPKDVGKKAKKLAPIALAKISLKNLEALKAAIDARLSAKNLEKDVSFHIDQRGLTVGLIGSETFFRTNQAALTPTSQEIITTMAPVLQSIPNQVSLQGYADPRPPLPPYSTNWDLASARALSVLKEMNGPGRISGKRLDAVSYGDTRTATGQSLADERRVDIVVLSDQPADVRDLIPRLLREQGSASSGSSSPGPSGSPSSSPVGQAATS